MLVNNNGKLDTTRPLDGLTIPEMIKIYGDNSSGADGGLRGADYAIYMYMRQCVRSYAGSWNIPDNLMDQYGNGLASINAQNIGTRSPYPYDQIIENYAYWLGEQLNVPYEFMNRTISGQTLPVTHKPSQKAFEVVSFLEGLHAKLYRATKPHVKTIDRNSLSKKEFLVQMQEVVMALKEEFRAMAEEDGIMMGDENIIGSAGEEDMESILDISPKDKMEVLGNEILQHIVTTNMFAEQQINSARDYIIGKWTAFHVRIQNGDPYIDRIHPGHLIFDPNYDCDFNSRGRYRGIIEFLSPTEIAERGYDGFTKEDFEELEKYQREPSSSVIGPYISASPENYKWYYGELKKFTVITMYWIGNVDIGIKVVPGKKTNQYRDVNKDDESGDYMKPKILCGTLIANWKCVNYGYLKHVAYKPGDRLEELIPIQMFAPGITRGRCRSAVDRTKDFIGQIEAYRLRIAQKAAKMHGKVPVLNAAAFKKKPHLLMDDISTWGFVFANFSNGEWIDPTTNKRLADVLDFTADQDLKTLMELAAEEERRVDSVFNTTPIVTGGQRTYVGYGVQQDTIQQATMGTSNTIEKHATFCAKTLFVAVNMYKSFLASKEGKKKAEYILSMSSYRFLKSTDDILTSVFGAYITIFDTLDQAERQSIIALAQTILPSGVDPRLLETMIDLIKQPTANQMKSQIRALARQIIRDNAKAEAEKAELEMIKEEKRNAVPLQQTAMEEEGKTGREAMKEEGLDARKMADIAAKTSSAGG